MTSLTDLAALHGRRVSLRYLLPDGQATDLVGRFTSAGERVSVQPEWGPAVELAASAVVAARAVPDPVIRPSSSVAKLAWLIDRELPDPDGTRLGGWLLPTDGPALPLGDPGVDLSDAVERVETLHADRGTAFQLHQPLPGSPRPDPVADLADLLADRGYQVRSDGLVLLAELPPATAAPGDHPHLTDQPDAQWASLIRDAHPHRAARLLRPGPGSRFARLNAGGATAVARLQLHKPWAGLQALTVAGETAGRDLLAALLRQARTDGARYVHALTFDPAARRLLEAAGFRRHHRVRVQEATR